MKYTLKIVAAVSVSAFILSAAAEAQMRWEKANWRCTGKGDQKRISAQLWDIPWGQDWEAACRAQRTGPYGLRKRPDQCIENAGMWGVWYVSSPKDCAPKLTWAGEQRYCKAWKSTVTARLWGIRPGASWEERCEATKASGAIASTFGASGTPDRCVKGKLQEGIWGEWDIADDGNCPESRVARYPLAVSNKTSAPVFATVMWTQADGTMYTNGSGWVAANASRDFSIAGIDCDPDEISRRLNQSTSGSAATAFRDAGSPPKDTCLGEHFQVLFWDSEAAFLHYAAENATIQIAATYAADFILGKIKQGIIPLPGAEEAGEFASKKWRELRDPNSDLAVWGVHGWAYNVPQQQASVYYWGRHEAQDIILDSAGITSPEAPVDRFPKFVYELPFGAITPPFQQTRECDNDC